MSSPSISQIEYWRNAPKGPNDLNGSAIKNVSEGGPGAAYLSYDVFMGLSILGGFFALDHLYLRSPLTFIAKIIVNILTLGAWWLYDASQAVFNKDVVKVFGLGIPGLGPKGIAAGVLGSDTPDKKHMAFFAYGLALILGGAFGLDSFVTGDSQSGIIRLIAFISIILTPVALAWWGYNLFKFFFKTKDVIGQNFEYFGAPPPAEYTQTLGEKIVAKIPIVGTLLSPIIGATKATNTSGPASLITAPIEIAGKTFAKVVKNTATELKPVLEPAAEVLQTALEPTLTAVAPLKQTLNAGIDVAQSGIQTVQDALVLGKTALDAGTEIAGRTLNVVGQTTDAATKALTLAPAAAAMSTGFTPGAAQAALSKLQQGGNTTANSNILGYTLLGTFGVIAVSGLILTYRRFRQNEQQSKRSTDDSPPEPGVL